MQKIGSIAFDLQRKPIKHLRIHVLPPDGAVQVAAPQSFSDLAIRLAFIARIPWIKKQQQAFAEQARQAKKEWVSGECHYLWGKAYRLQVVAHTGKHEVRYGKDNYLQLWVRAGTTGANKAKVINNFYREELARKVPPLLAKWQKRIGVEVLEWRTRQMKTKWGSCNIEAQRLLLNLDLAQKPISCLEYVLVHEMTHLLERHHSARFVAYMDKFMPDWRERRALLNRQALSHNTFEA